jgi:hypothetical protein
VTSGCAISTSPGRASGSSPAISIDLNAIALACATTAASRSSPFGRRAGNDSGAIIGRWQAARRLSWAALRARQGFDIVSVDPQPIHRRRVTDAEAQPEAASADLVEMRSGDRQLTRVTFDLVQHF